MEQNNEVATLQLQNDVLKQQNDEIKNALTLLTGRFSSMGTFVKEGFERIQQQVVEHTRPDKVYVVHPTHSETIGELSKAMSAAKAEISPISRGGMAQRGKFASLEDMFEVCDPIMAKYDLSSTFGLNTNEHGEFIITMLLSHCSGEWIENRALLKELEGNSSVPYHQRVASAEKSLRRYMYRAMLNLAEEGN